MQISDTHPRRSAQRQQRPDTRCRTTAPGDLEHRPDRRARHSHIDWHRRGRLALRSIGNGMVIDLTEEPIGGGLMATTERTARISGTPDETLISDTALWRKLRVESGPGTAGRQKPSFMRPSSL